MTLPANSYPIGGSMPTAHDREAANQLRRIVAATKGDTAKLNIIEPDTHNKIEINLSPIMSDLLLDVLRHISSGNAVTLVPIEQALTTQQAADILNVSRPYLINLLEKGEISFERVGRHRRIKADDLFSYKATRDKARSQAMDELISQDADLL